LKIAGLQRFFDLFPWVFLKEVQGDLNLKVKLNALIDINKNRCFPGRSFRHPFGKQNINFSNAPGPLIPISVR